MLIVIALGGNAILQRNQPLEAAIQRKNIRHAAMAIAKIAKNHQIVLTHGNGPQVGLLALQNEAYQAVESYPLDVLGAETEGMIGYLFEQELRNQLPGQKIITLLTQTEIDKNDPAFLDPTKFVGPVYDEQQAKKLVAAKGWSVKADGQYFRRVVPSPMPQAIVELPSIQYIVAAGDISLICAGGGGIPVIRDEQGLQGVEAVVDKDHASNLLAQGIKADALILLTDIVAVETVFGQADSQAIKQAAPDDLAQFEFAKGSMGPKVEAVCDFVKQGGQFAAIGSLQDAADILAGCAGTRVQADCDGIEYY